VHLRSNGFPVQAENVENLESIKRKHGVPSALEACHTALVGGYVVEGHVPADLIDRLLRERPPIAGIAVPGMPAGAPGMETAGRRPEPYQVIAFDRSGRTSIFASR
jgi:hypothetical protein